MRGLVRAAAYLPRGSDGVGRRRSIDEDALTMVAAAVERAGAAGAARPAATRVRRLGDARTVDAAALEAVLGGPVSVVPDESGPGSLGRALEGARDGPGPEWIVAARVASGRSPVPPGEGAAALLVDEAPGSLSLPALSSPVAPETEEGALAALFRLADPRSNPSVWVGDWGDDPAEGIRVPSERPADDPPVAAISQGAFVPGPRDEESRPSRWRFAADRCAACGARTFPRRGRCRACGRSDRLSLEPLPLTNATVVAVTWIGQGGQPTEFDPLVAATGPYGVVLAELVPGVRVTLAVADAEPQEVRVGSKVDTALRRLYPIDGEWRYGRKAIPARDSRRGPGPPSAAGTAR